MPGILKAVPRMLLDPDGPLALRLGDLPGMTPWLFAFLRSATPSEVDRIVRELGLLVRAASEAQEELLREAGAGHLARRHGCLYVYRTKESFDAAQKDIELRAREGVAMTVLEPDEVHALEPNLARIYHKGLRFDDAWHFDMPHDYALALARHFREGQGAFRQASVSALHPAKNGLALAGDPLGERFDRAVIAAGAWSKALAKTLGDEVLLDTERGYHIMFPEGGSLLNRPVCYPEFGFYMTPTREGLRCAGTVELGGLDKPPRANRTAAIERVARRLVPQAGESGASWMGFRPSMPDSLPVIARSPSDPRVIHAYGHGHIGLTLAALTGRLVAELIAGKKPSLDLSALRADRFSRR